MFYYIFICIKTACRCSTNKSTRATQAAKSMARSSAKQQQQKRKAKNGLLSSVYTSQKLSNMPRYNDDAGRKYGERVQDHSGRGVRYHPGTFIHTHAQTTAHAYTRNKHTHTHRYIYTRMWGERKRQKERSASLDNTTCTRCHTHTHTKKRKEVLRNIHAPHKIVLYNIFGCRGQKQHSLRLKPVCLGELT